MKTLSFTNGDKMPILGLGTWQSSPAEVYDAVKTAIKTGYRMIDCARIYGNEDVVGDAVADAISEGLVVRNELFITSKLWNDSHGFNAAMAAAKSTLEALKLKWLDLYLIHWPMAFKAGVKFPKKADDFYSLAEMPLQETWRAMEAMKAKGWARHIGVSNFGKAKLSVLFASSRVRPEMNQIEINPFFQERDLVDFCAAHDVRITGYSPLGTSDEVSVLLENPAIVRIAKRRKCTPAQVCLAWGIARGYAVVPKSINPERIAENFGALQVALDKSDMAEIAHLNEDRRMLDVSDFEISGSPYTIKSLFD